MESEIISWSWGLTFLFCAVLPGTVVVRRWNSFLVDAGVSLGSSAYMRLLPDGEPRLVHALYKYSIFTLQLPVQLGFCKDHGALYLAWILFIMTIAPQLFRQCILRTSRNGTLLCRTFHASLARPMVRPFLLSDIGEGKNWLSFLHVFLLSPLRYQRSTDYTMVR